MTIPAPPFVYAGIIMEGRMEVRVALDAFCRYVAKGDEDNYKGSGASDVEALMYLTGQLKIMGRPKEAHMYLDMAVSADPDRAATLYERLLTKGSSLLDHALLSLPFIGMKIFSTA